MVQLTIKGVAVTPDAMRDNARKYRGKVKKPPNLASKGENKISHYFQPRAAQAPSTRNENPTTEKPCKD